MRHVLGATLAMLLCACGGSEQSNTTITTQPVMPPPVLSGPIVFMGDSITAAWTDLQTLAPGSINSGIPGNRSTDMDARFQTDALDYHPDLIVILAGTNDVCNAVNPTTAALFDMVQKAEASGAAVIVGTIPPLGDWSHCGGAGFDAATGNAELAQWNTDIRTGAGTYGYRVADYYRVLVNPDGTQNTSLFKSDFIHPDEAGYAVMDPVLKPLLNIVPH